MTRLSQVNTIARGKPIVVVGSINMDLVCRSPRVPLPGQTFIGSDLITIPGGKGANQAVAAAKLGADVHFVARVGDDDFGQRLINGLQNHGVRIRHVTVTEGVSSGCAMVLVDGKGENAIVVAPGANAKVTPADVDRAGGLIRSAGVVLVQLEIPYETVLHTIDMCRKAGVFTILDPAPAPTRRLPRAMYNVDILTPNESESQALVHSRTKLRVEARQVGSDLLRRGPRAVVLKLGARGAMIVTGAGHIEQIKPHKVKVADTTAAGDAFAAGLAVSLSEGKDLSQAVHFANACGARACETFGAQPALPTRAAVERLLAGRI